MDNRNLYLNGTIDEARASGYDIVQLKYDGWWTRAVFEPTTIQFYSETGRPYNGAGPVGHLVGTELVGEMMRGTQWSLDESRRGKFFVYDIRAVVGQPITTETYMQRYRLLRTLKLPAWCVLVQCFPIDAAEVVWQKYVLNEGYEGIVFRRMSSPITDAIMRQKREYTVTGYAIGFEEGLGKHAGRLGAIVVASGENGKEGRVGTGFSDAEREEIWANRSKYLGKPFDYTANAIFESGNVRHARFSRWREDKQ